MDVIINDNDFRFKPLDERDMSSMFLQPRRWRQNAAISLNNGRNNLVLLL